MKLEKLGCVTIWVVHAAVFSTALVSQARPFSLADDIGVSRFGDPNRGKAEAITYSPDGRYFIVDTERGRIDLNKPESTIRVYRAADVRQFLTQPTQSSPVDPLWTFSKATYSQGSIITSIRWLTDSSGFAFLMKTGGGSDQLFLADIATKDLQPLTPVNQQVQGFDIRDRLHIVYAVLNPAIIQKGRQQLQTPSFVGTGEVLDSLLLPPTDYSFLLGSDLLDQCELWAMIDGHRFRVKVAATGEPIHVYHAGATKLALSQDGRYAITAMPVARVPGDWTWRFSAPRRLSAFRMKTGPQDLESLGGRRYVHEWALIDLKSGTVRRLTNAPLGTAVKWSSAAGPAFSLSGRFAVLPNTFLSGSFEAQQPESERSRPCVAVAELASGVVTCVERFAARGEEGYDYIWSARFAPDDDHLEVDWRAPGTESGQRLEIYARSSDGSWHRVPPRGSVPESESMSIMVRESANVPPVLVARDATTHMEEILLDPNPQLATVERSAVSVVKGKDRAGRAWVGGLYTPPDSSGTHRYPLVIQTHGFNERVFVPSGVYPTAFAAQELAAVGIAVLQINECPEVDTPEEGPCNVALIDSAVERLVRDGIADPERLAIVGFSRTCFHVLEELTTGVTQFKAASITDGVSFGYMEYLEEVDYFGTSGGEEGEMVVGAPAFGAGLEQWLKRAPAFHLDQVTAPLQVVANGRKGLLEMWEPYAQLRHQHKPVDLIVLNTAEHVITTPSVRIASQGGTVDWMRFWLQGYQDPDPAKAEQYKRWEVLRRLQDTQSVRAPSVKPMPHWRQTDPPTWRER